MNNNIYMKGCALGIIGLLIAASVLLVGGGAAEKTTVKAGVVCGDCNNNGVVESGGLVCYINHLFKGIPAEPPVCRLDANCDGVVDLGDIVYLVGYFYKGAAPPCPDCCPEE